MWLRSLFLFILFLCPQGYGNVHKTLNSLSQKDRENIEFLFRYWVQRDTLGFLLFGESKCLTFTGIPLTHKECFLPGKIENGYRFQRKLVESWYTWKTHESRFKHPNYLICEKYQRLENETYLQLFIFDIPKLKIVLNKYVDEFKKVCGDSFTPESFIAKLHKKRVLMPLIRHDEKLLGLLLGFGREASTLFRDYADVENLNPPMEYLGKRPTGCLITPVSFRGYSSSEETKHILDAFRKEIVEIERIFKSEQFFHRAIEKFCS